MKSTATRERPILFRGEMVRAILDGTKTQTRRVVKDPWVYDGETGVGAGWEPPACPYGTVGDRLWVRETFAPMGDMRPSGMWTDPKWIGRNFFYAADNDRPTWAGSKWKPSIFMPREACRIVLEITDGRVELLNDISEEDAIAEGVRRCDAAKLSHEERAYYDYASSFGAFGTAKESYKSLWESINGDGSWDANPFVWALTFRVIKD